MTLLQIKELEAQLQRRDARIAELEAQLPTGGDALPEGISRDDTVHGATYFTAADMATAAAQGFRDGVASLSLPAAGQEPVAYAMFADGGNIRLWSTKPLPHPDAVPLYAAPQPAVAAGWVMVPVEPTTVMLAAGCPAGEMIDHFDLATAYRAMLKAAPIPPAPSTEGESNE